MSNEAEPFNDENRMKSFKREENMAALTYTTIWLGLASVIFTLLGQLIITNDELTPSWLLVYIEGIVFICMILFIGAGMLFFHGSSIGHTKYQYIEFNENGDSLIMCGVLLLILCFSLLFSFIIHSIMHIQTWFAILISILATMGLLVLIENGSIEAERTVDNTAKVSKKNENREFEGIVTHYINEGGRIFLYRGKQDHDKENWIEEILSGKYDKQGNKKLTYLILLIILIPIVIDLLLMVK